MNALTHLALATMIALAGPILALMAASPADGPFLVLTWPWVDGIRLVSQASGWVVGPDVASLAVLAWSDAPDFAARLNEAGAILVRDGRLIAEICGVTPK